MWLWIEVLICILLKTSKKTLPAIPKETTPGPVQLHLDRLELNAVFQTDLSQQCAALLYPLYGTKVGLQLFN